MQTLKDRYFAVAETKPTVIKTNPQSSSGTPWMVSSRRRRSGGRALYRFATHAEALEFANSDEAQEADR